MTYGSEEAILGLYQFWLGIIIIIAVLGLLWIIFAPRRTRSYRRDLTNLYVAGRIRQIAKKDNINIPEEYELFKQFVKKSKMEDWDLDQTIEEELKEKVAQEEKKEMKGI